MQQLLYLVPGALGRPQAGSYGPFAVKGHHHCASPAHGSREASRTIVLLVTQLKLPGPQGNLLALKDMAKVNLIKGCIKLFGPRAKCLAPASAAFSARDVIDSQPLLLFCTNSMPPKQITLFLTKTKRH